MIANYHTHTFRCRHAGGTDREYVEAAINGGLRILGFADHTPFPHAGFGCGMQMEELADYVESIQSLKKEYKNEIEIYVGLEVENAPAEFFALMELLKKYPLDYLILGQHAVFDIPGYKEAFKKTEDPCIFEAYCRQAAEAMESGVFSYWAHPDVIFFQGDELFYEQRMRQLCQIAKKYHLPLEINFNGILQGRNYPTPKFWRIAGEENCQVIFGIDAHQPEQLKEVDKPLKVAQKLVEEYHLDLLDSITLKRPFNEKKYVENNG